MDFSVSGPMQWVVVNVIPDPFLNVTKW